MKELLERIRKANPALKISSVHDPEFAVYGRVVEADTESLVRQACRIPLPESGTCYTASVPELENCSEGQRLLDRCWGGLDAQTGICMGHSASLNALEWHLSSEFDLAATDLVLFLADRRKLCAGRLDSAAVEAFYLRRGELVELYGTTLHFCPCEVTESGFRCIVSLPRGTNLPLDGSCGKTPHLWAVNKWLIAHEQNTALLARGADAGIYGENWTLAPAEPAEK